MFEDIRVITEWLDDSNTNMVELDKLMRVAKIGEELGEAARAMPRRASRVRFIEALTIKFGRCIEAIIGMTGQNPRKGFTHNEDDLLNELADVMVTAACAIQNRTQNVVHTEAIVRAKLAHIRGRVGI